MNSKEQNLWEEIDKDHERSQRTAESMVVSEKLLERGTLLTLVEKSDRMKRKISIYKKIMKWHMIFNVRWVYATGNPPKTIIKIPLIPLWFVRWA